MDASHVLLSRCSGFGSETSEHRSRAGTRILPMPSLSQRSSNAGPVWSRCGLARSVMWAGGGPNARALQGDHGHCYRFLSAEPVNQRRRQGRHHHWVHEPTASLVDPAARTLSATSRKRRTPCSSRPPRHASSLRVDPACMPASYPRFSSPGISPAFLSQQGRVCASANGPSSEGRAASRTPRRRLTTVTRLR